MPNSSQNADGPENLTIPYARVVDLVRHLTHDVRNGLNTLDLQTAFLKELIAPEHEAAPEVKRLRGMISATAKMLQGFSSSFWLGEPHFVTYSAAIFVEDFRTRIEALLPDLVPLIEWTIDLGEEAISVDLEMLFRGYSEFFKNALHFREKDQTITACFSIKDGRFLLALCEEKTSVPSAPDGWGREPLNSTRRGGYGMGLFHARQILAVHQVTLHVAFDPAGGLLTTEISLPLAPG